MERGLGLVLNGQITEADPGLAVLDSLELVVDLLIFVTGLLDNLPKAKELVVLNLAIAVHVDGLKEFLRRKLAETVLLLGPVSNGLLNVDGLASVDVEGVEGLLNHGQRGWAERLTSKH